MNNVIKFLCLNALLIGSASLAMDVDKGEELIETTKKRNLELVQRLLDAGAPINAKDGNGNTSLEWAAYEGHDQMCKFLIDHNANVNITNSAGRTPLMTAAHRGYLQICNILIQNNALVNAKANGEWTPLKLAAACYHRPICELFIDEILKPIKQKINAIVAFLGLKKRCKYMRLIDREIMKLIARQLYEPIKPEVQNLFDQINTINCESFRNELRAYAQQQLKLKMDQKTNNGGSHEQSH